MFGMEELILQRTRELNELNIQIAAAKADLAKGKGLVKTRLEADVYTQLVKQCPAIAVTNDTSPMQASFQLGVQHVLKLLREGFVIEQA